MFKKKKISTDIAKKSKGIFAEFKKFITRGNIVDMSVGIIVGGAFTAIVNGLTNNILKPVINWVIAQMLGKDGLSGAITVLSPSYVLDEAGNATTELDLANSIYIDWGAFISAIINFLLIAVVLFALVKIINTVSEQSKKLADIKTSIEFKQAHGIKLSKKEVRFLEAEKIKEAEQKAKEEEEARKKAEEEAKLTRSEALLTEIVELLKNKK